MRVNRAKFASLAQSSVDVSGTAFGALSLTPAAGSSNRTSSSDTAESEDAKQAQAQPFAAAQQLGGIEAVDPAAAAAAAAVAAATAATVADGCYRV